MLKHYFPYQREDAEKMIEFCKACVKTDNIIIVLPFFQPAEQTLVDMYDYRINLHSVLDR